MSTRYLKLNKVLIKRYTYYLAINSVYYTEAFLDVVLLRNDLSFL